MKRIDLKPEERGMRCECCGEAAAEARDADLGGVCAVCLGAGLLAEKALRAVGCVEDEILQGLAAIRRNLEASHD
jgi:hypothetical protein